MMPISTSRRTNPKNLGTTINVINPSDGRWGPYVTSDNKYMFYSRGISPADGCINWIRVDNLIDSLKHTNFIPYIKKSIPNQTVKKDSLFNYQIPDSTFIDDDGNSTLKYTVTLINGNPLPAWLSFDSIGCKLSGTPDTTIIYTIKVTATDTAGVTASTTFKINVENSLGVEGTSQAPDRYVLLNNYPNPFNPSTTIAFKIPVKSFVSLRIFDLRGREVSTLIFEELPAGIHTRQWNAVSKSSGIYLCRLQSGNIIETKKIVLLK